MQGQELLIYNHQYSLATYVVTMPNTLSIQSFIVLVLRVNVFALVAITVSVVTVHSSVLMLVLKVLSSEVANKLMGTSLKSNLGSSTCTCKTCFCSSAMDPAAQ